MKDKYQITPISPRVETSEVKTAGSELFRLFQDATFELIEAQAERDRCKMVVDSMKAELTVDVANENRRLPRLNRMNTGEKEAKVAAGLRPKLRELAVAEKKVQELTNIINMFRFLGNQLSTLSMVSASERKFAVSTPSIPEKGIGNGNSTGN